MTTNELIELVPKVMAADGTEEEIDAWTDAISRAVPHPNWADLIYYDDRELSPEEVVAEALAYKPILL